MSTENKENKQHTNNKSGHRGVCLDSRGYWKATWNIKGKKHQKSFSINKYGWNNAKKLAIELRQTKENEFSKDELYEDKLAQIKSDSPYSEEQDIIEKQYTHIPKSNKSGHRGICLDSKGNAWKATMNIKGVKHQKSFSINKYGYDNAKKLAIKFRQTKENEFSKDELASHQKKIEK